MTKRRKREELNPRQNQWRDAEAVEAAGQEVDHGRLTISTPSEVADADYGHGQRAVRLEPREKQGQAERVGRGGKEGEGEGMVEEGEVPHGGVRGGGKASDELPRRLLHTIIPVPVQGRRCGRRYRMGCRCFAPAPGRRRRRRGGGGDVGPFPSF